LSAAEERKATPGWAAQNPKGHIGSFADATNPIADAPPTNGVLRFFTNLDDSLMERLQREFGNVRFVKAFNPLGNAGLSSPAE
jgi:hypothetical protein